MTSKRRIDLIQRVIEDHDRLDFEWDRLIKVIKNHDMPLFEASWKVFDSYLASISREIGDEQEWLSWYIHENHCGLRGMSARPAKEIPLKPIRTVKALVALIEYRVK